MKKFIAAIALSLIAAQANAQVYPTTCVKKTFPELTPGDSIIVNPFENKLLYSSLTLPPTTVSAKVLFWTAHLPANVWAPGSLSLWGYTIQQNDVQLVVRTNEYESNFAIPLDLFRYPFEVRASNNTSAPQDIEFALSVEYCYATR